MADKHTKRDLFQTLLVLAVATESEKWVQDGIQHELELLDRKRSSSKGDAKKKAEQASVKAEIRAFLSDADEPQRAGEIAKGVDTSIQRVSALLKQMVESGEVTRTEDKKVATFSL